MNNALKKVQRPLGGMAVGGGAFGGQSLTDQAYAALEERIATLKLQPGELVSEYALVEEVGLGRTPIREALQQLAREGLVQVLPRRGILVTQSDAGQQLLVLEVRREIERLLSRSAAKRATLEQRAALEAVADGMDKSARKSDDVAFMRLDREHNELLLASAHNVYAAGAMGLINGHSRRFWYQHYKQAADLPLCARLHAEQAWAIVRGDEAAAAEASDRLIDYTEAFTRAIAGQP